MNIKNIKEYLFMLIGAILVAISIEYFFAPNNIAGGGLTGLAIIINYIYPKVAISIITLIGDIILFSIAFIVLGKVFGKRTIVASLSLSISMWIIETYLKPDAITNDLIISTIFGTLISAVGMVMIFNSNSSSGGTDIIAKILNKYFNVNIGMGLLMIDFIITIFAVFILGVNSGLYGLLSVISLGLIIDRIIDGVNSVKEVLIITSNPEKISEHILNNIQRGCTYIKGEGVYTKKELKIIYTILSRSEYIKLKKYIIQEDSKAFISVRESYEALGEGFKEIKN